MKASLATWASVLCLVTGTATAANTGMFFDVSAGQSKVENLEKSSVDSEVAAVGTLNGSTIDDMGTYWAVSLGYQFLPYLAADIGWASLGAQTYKASFTNASTVYQYKVKLDSGGPTTGITGILPIGKRIELRGRVGVLFATTSLHRSVSNSTLTTLESSDENSVEAFANIAAAFKFTPKFSAYVSFHHFNKVGTGDFTGESDVNGASLGVTFRQ